MNHSPIGPLALAAIAASMENVSATQSPSPRYHHRSAQENGTRSRNRKRNKIAKASRRRNRK